MEFVRHHRSLNAVMRAANKLDLYKHQGNWTEEEDAILTTYYKSEGEQAFSRLPNRSIRAIRTRVLRLNLQKRFAWSEEEDDIIRSIYPKSVNDCSAKLSNRSRTSIIARAYRLGVVYTGAERIVKCVELNIPYTLSEAAARYDKTKSAFINACKTGGCCAGYHWEYVKEDRED